MRIRSKIWRWLLTGWLGLSLLGVGPGGSEARAASLAPKASFPRLMGMNIGDKNYQDPDYQNRLAKLDVVVLGFYPGWNPQGEDEAIAKVVRRLKSLNPTLLVGQYTILNEAYDNLDVNKAEGDKYRKLYQEGWWLTDAAGAKVQWTADYNAWDVNFTKWAKADPSGRRYPEWLAERDFRLYFEKLGFDIWYFDNVFDKARVAKADWQRNGTDERPDDPQVAQAYRAGQLAEWQAARRLAPGLLLWGNSDNDLSSDEYRGKLQGAFLEGLMGRYWSLETRQGWGKMMERYRTVKANTADPHLVGFNVWGAADDYRFFRYAFASCLLDDGYFSYTDAGKGYSGVVWFDEYDVDLGLAVEPPQTQPWQQGVYRRLFEKGMVLVNPNRLATTLNIGPGYRAVAGRQDPLVNHGRPLSTVTIAGRDGLVLVKGPVPVIRLVQ